MEEKLAEPKATVDGYSFRWMLSNSLGLIYLVCYQGHVLVSSLQALLDGSSAAFESRFAKSRNSIDKLIGTQVDFLPTFERISEVTLGSSSAAAPSPYLAPPVTGASSGINSDVESISSQTAPNSAPKSGNRRSGPRPFQAKQKISQSGAGDSEDPQQSSNRKQQLKRDWAEFGIIDKNKTTVSQKEIAALDMSKKSGAADVDDEEQRRRARLFHGIDDATSGGVIGAESDSEDDADTTASGNVILKVARSILPKFATRWIGGVTLSDEEVQEALDVLEKKLMAKNVARDVAVQICQSVKTSLVGTSTATFQSVHSAVKQALAEAVRKVLTPKRSVDVLRMAQAAKARGQVFSICFLGTNGVGKSTNLAKVAYYLQQRGGLRVLIAACDTFRSGAVEQLRSHARNLDVFLFERGYGKDASAIAEEALQLARTDGYDVVLIDTAGRMQDNEPLMRAIGKLVSVNRPDLVLFVGEALVGNDAVDQLVKFNSALFDQSSPPRGVDGILLSKFDTVDDKVGAALTMVSATGQPIVFVGTGQKYPHLRKLHVGQVVDALMA